MVIGKDDFETINGVFVSSKTRENFSDFEAAYIKARSKEKRVLDIEEIRHLPNVSEKSPHFDEWNIRKKNITRFLNYLSEKKSVLKILDIGCGNGFFTNLMSGNEREVIGLDVNLTELVQAKEAFPNSKIKWYYVDLLNENIPEKNFDIITFCASFQYFKDSKKILARCQSLLNKNGEIHIIDSPFYNSETRNRAKNNSIIYYQSLDVSEMSSHYNHHDIDVLKEYNIEYKYKPKPLLLKLFKDSPFPWIKIT